MENVILKYLLFAFAVFVVCPTVINVLLFRKTTYFKITHNGFFKTRFNKGRNGEYLTYIGLRKYEKTGGKFLFNVYLPKENEETTEIDVMLICTKGIFVVESKNYSGWIFGSEKQKTWTQSLPQGKGRPSLKEHFLNPIMQNKLHIKALKSVIGEETPIYSVIAFSERCTLKDVTVTDKQIKVVNRNRILNAVKNLAKQNETEIEQSQVEEIFNVLYPYSQVSEEVKEKHISDIVKDHETEQKPEEEIKKENEQKTAIKETEEKEETINTAEQQVEAEQEEEKQEELPEENAFGENKEKIGAEEELKCPLCGETLVLRKAKRGENVGKQFYGCSNYPKCRYIKNI